MHMEKETKGATLLQQRVEMRLDRLGVAKQDFADHMGVSRVTLRNWLAGGSENMKHRQLQKLAEELGVSLEYLISEGDELWGESRNASPAWCAKTPETTE